MHKELELVKFIKTNNNWEQLLSSPPYSISITRDFICKENLIMFKYNQIDSDFSKKICVESRGIVLNEDTLDVVSYGFDKFFNAGEQFAANIDPKTMFSSVKIDGSIIKIVKIDDDILISSNGTINAFNAPVPEQIGCPYKSFGDIVIDIIIEKFGSKENFISKLNNGYTYIFELVSPWTRVCIPYPENDLYLIGCRDNDIDHDYREIFFNDCHLKEYFKTPDILKFDTIESCFNYTKTLDWTNEGYVVMDRNFNRVKVKNPSWLSVHHLANNHTMSYSRAIELVRLNEVDEVLSYFPEFEKALLDCKDRFWKLVKDTENEWDDFTKISGSLPSRKDKAIYIQKNFKIPGIAFGMIDGKISSIKDFFMNVPTDKISKWLGYKE